MSLLTIPNVLVNGTGPANIVDAVGLNANFNAIATAVNNIYPLQVIPTNTTQATFGGTVAYTFPDALYVDGASGLTATGIHGGSTGSNGFLIQSHLISSGSGVGMTFDIPSGAKTSWTYNNTASTALSLSSSVLAMTGGQISSSMVASQGGPGLLVNGAASITGNLLQIDLTSGGTHSVQVTANGSLVVGSNGFNAGNGAITSALSSTTGEIVFGGTSGSTTGAGALAFGPTTYNFFSAGLGGSTANILASSGVYTPTSDARLKENVAALALGLAEVLRLRPVSFDWIESKDPGQGFLAQDMQQVVPLAVRMVDEKTGILGISDALITPVVVKAMQEFYAEFKAWTTAHP